MHTAQRPPACRHASSPCAPYAALDPSNSIGETLHPSLCRQITARQAPHLGQASNRTNPVDQSLVAPNHCPKL